MSQNSPKESALTFWQPTDENIFEYFDDKLGWKAWEGGAPRESILDLKEPEFLAFLKNLDGPKKKELLDILGRYDSCLSAIKDEVYPYASALQTTALMAVIELVMGQGQYMRLDEYLRRAVKSHSPISEVELNRFIEAYHREYSQRNTIKSFFSELLTDEEKQQLLNYLKTCPEWVHCDTISKFADQLLEYRHKFVHELSRTSLWPFPARLRLGTEGKSHSAYPTVSPSQLIGIIWKGVLRKFGFKGQM